MKLKALLDDLQVISALVENGNYVAAEDLLHEMIEETKWEIHNKKRYDQQKNN